MYKVLTLNNISVVGLERLPRSDYEIASEIQHPDAILLRSFKMHDMAIPETLKAVGRAGAGVNNIPVDKLSGLGIPVFNAPGANANAVKELTIAGLFLACRNVCQAWDYTRNLQADDGALSKLVEAGKKKFAGSELPGRTLGVIGLGAIGGSVANTAVALGMNVIGFDPGLTVEGAWQLSSEVQQASSIDELVRQVDYLTVHVPLIEATKNMIHADRIAAMKEGAVVLNFARDGIIDENALLESLDSGRLSAYVTDFPTNQLLGNEKVITLPHLGASTQEAEDNCAIMVAEQVRDYLENGNVRNSVNFPEVVMPRTEGSRVAVVNSNVPNMVGQISTTLANSGINIIDMLNRSRGDLAYTLIDIDQAAGDSLIADLAGIDGVLAVRTM